MSTYLFIFYLVLLYYLDNQGIINWRAHSWSLPHLPFWALGTVADVGVGDVPKFGAQSEEKYSDDAIR